VFDKGNHQNPLALVLGGGGAHAAYQVGFLRALAREFPDLEIPILTGVSAGAINAVYLANHTGSFKQAVDDLVAMWQGLTIDQIFRTETLSLLKNLLHWQLSLMSGGLIRSPTERGLVDSSPLHHLLQREFFRDGQMLAGIESKLQACRLKAVAVTATDYHSDRAVTWVQGKDVESWKRPHRFSIEAELSLEHVMASTALPLFFRAVQIGNQWYGDGGMRQTSPLAPALHLGAARILAISTRYERQLEKQSALIDTSQPQPAQIVGTLLGSIFLDLLVQDARNLERINQLVSKLPEAERDGLREVQLFLLQPSSNISELSGELRHHLPWMFNYLVRGLGTHKVVSPDWLSLVMFDANYLKRLMEIGEQDAKKSMAHVAELVAPD